MKYVAAMKSGRAFNGAHRDAGKIVHLVEPLPENCSGDWFTKSLCGTIPGYRGNGWHETTLDVNCEKCIKKFNQNTTEI